MYFTDSLNEVLLHEKLLNFIFPLEIIKSSPCNPLLSATHSPLRIDFLISWGIAGSVMKI